MLRSPLSFPNGKCWQTRLLSSRPFADRSPHPDASTSSAKKLRRTLSADGLGRADRARGRVVCMIIGITLSTTKLNHFSYKFHDHLVLALLAIAIACSLVICIIDTWKRPAVFKDHIARKNYIYLLFVLGSVGIAMQPIAASLGHIPERRLRSRIACVARPTGSGV
jgi:hypothetical protein